MGEFIKEFTDGPDKNTVQVDDIWNEVRYPERVVRSRMVGNEIRITCTGGIWEPYPVSHHDNSETFY